MTLKVIEPSKMVQFERMPLPIRGL